MNSVPKSAMVSGYPEAKLRQLAKYFSFDLTAWKEAILAYLNRHIVKWNLFVFRKKGSQLSCERKSFFRDEIEVDELNLTFVGEILLKKGVKNV